MSVLSSKREGDPIRISRVKTTGSKTKPKPPIIISKYSATANALQHRNGEPLFIEAHQKCSVAQFHVSGSSLTTREDVLKYLNQSCFSELYNLEYTNGLVYLWNDVGEVAICNPFTKEHVFLPRQIPKEKGYMACCSLCFDPITKKHKVFKTLGDQNSCEVACWIFTIGVDKSWREIADCTNFFPLRYNCVYIGGVIYCVNRLATAYNIVAFSVGDEKLIRMILTPFEVLTSEFPPKIFEIKGQVALLDGRNFLVDGKFHLYIFNGTGENEEWVKHIIELLSESIPKRFCPSFNTNPKGEIVLFIPVNTDRIFPVFLRDIAKKEWTKFEMHGIYERGPCVSIGLVFC
uniref:F-box protein At5g15660 n=1 Tax=Nicotiana sylvestris TaxID=4096 RepID=A0A1U7V917_NICSY|nr:PREDICTED: putative F-box protein At5g15660 [Nicotiana sylvestris]